MTHLQSSRDACTMAYEGQTMTTQRCYSCKTILPIGSFNKKKTTKTGYQHICRGCQKKERKAYYDTHKEKELEDHRRYVNSNSEKVNKRRSIYRSESPVYYKKQQQKVIEKKGRDLGYLLFFRYRYRVGRAFAINGSHSSQNIRTLLGCTNDKFINHLEGTFTDGMSWEKYRSGEMQVDHIIPCACFNLKDERNHRACFHYTNTRMLSTHENAARRRNLFLSPEEIEAYIDRFNRGS